MVLVIHGGLVIGSWVGVWYTTTKGGVGWGRDIDQNLPWHQLLPIPPPSTPPSLARPSAASGSHAKSHFFIRIITFTYTSLQNSKGRKTSLLYVLA